ncbi:DUF72 domain-containing protein [Bacillus piscicola]|uniref:DUF72 domain-containing protein n=1 Tax=Bacillus piscicola TaxID=1632684 RepID=UPI001F0987FC|nr:DUF72 domain-containing protein [Bacillus piscicola]
MIYTGLTGWGDHHSLYPPGTKPGDKLEVYSSHFPIVEIDASFYAVQPAKNYEKWLNQTPDRFSFVVKAYQGITGHQRGEIPFSSKEEMFQAFKESVQPVQQAGKLGMILCQFPPWFHCSKENVQYLRYVREQLVSFPCALEFRHQSWFSAEFKKRTLDFMKNQNWIHSICDEPQVEPGSVPMVLEPTDSNKTLVRLHGRNREAWRRPVKGKSWRETRYLYDYSKTELEECLKAIKKLEKNSRIVYVVFNNNSGGHAAPNAKQFLNLAGIEYEGLAPRQISLFDPPYS